MPAAGTLGPWALGPEPPQAEMCEIQCFVEDVLHKSCFSPVFFTGFCNLLFDLFLQAWPQSLMPWAHGPLAQSLPMLRCVKSNVFCEAVVSSNDEY